MILNSKIRLLNQFFYMISSVIITYIFVKVITITRRPTLRLLFSMVAPYYSIPQ